MQTQRSHRVSLFALVSVLAALAIPQLASAQTHGSIGSAFGATIPPWTPVAPAPPPVDPQWQSWDPDYQMQSAQLHASPGGARVLRTAQAMLDQGTVVRGSCYDWIHAVFDRATGRWSDALRGRIQNGPYAEVQDFRPGDWVLFINEAYGGDASHTHSAIFVGWADASTRTAVMMSYPGGRRDEPGRYGTYELTHAYRIVRMADEAPVPRTRHRRSPHH
jgi:hypothetical protein